MNDISRCGWCGTDPLYQDYHDTEWGVPERDPRALWEKLILDGFQAGLSWITILRKRDAFREEFDDFNPESMASWDTARIEKALSNPGIIRHRGKIESTVRSARIFLDMETGEGFAPFIWGFTGGKTVQNKWSSLAQVPTQTPESQAMSKALKKQGFNFCGPVICYAFMQAVGIVNDHITTCHRHGPVSRLSAP
ncbi:MAG: DNA-3-methyladenine glycosylase I [Paracoccus sp. (in: a-proteobacteria)]|uniref:DNA-3-methyladenine glycosylase I n=1 Tax=Paracoccus sp. TaxID=267 RepID=UPI0026DF3920|nr:DNA-3-methyladenine glycosylase I [Paracoccus sp. (in: a-proteobacteria)]MDO5612395.1 DNA-3-methyladenine glycosylase I [Paracoccus sp. (in: a-proteobacteria)]MDO5630601.1 DNA-3-methyladenine glycosylase I [Paracoccus sp. (in: a-proteobacteria)]